MIDSPTLNHAARLLAGVSPDVPADHALRRYLADSRRLGPREKRSISRAIFTYYRWLSWLDAKSSLQKRVEQAFLLQERFDKNPASIKVQALAALAVPEWVAAEVSLPVETLRLFQRESTLWIRARPGTAPFLARQLTGADEVQSSRFSVQGFGDSATLEITFGSLPGFSALKYRGMQDLFLTPAFHAGAFEIQDLASQLVGHACDPHPGETWWDACAGEGGKLLHLADLMHNKGLIWATDRSARRLQTLKRRGTRAKLFNFRSALWDGSEKLPNKTKFDGILVDAPCSGLGTWQRNPHARWSTGPKDVRELSEIQSRLLANVAPTLKAGGKLVYAVCTLTRSETTAVADAFSAAHPDFEPLPVFGGKPQLTLWPHELEANGMFIAAWQKR